MKTLVVGLTGGIGSGKSTVSKLFNELGVPVIDTDVIARDVVQPGSFALAQIKLKLGQEALTATGELNRAQLRQLTFKDPALKAWLETLLHPLIRQQAKQQIDQVTTPYCLLVVPLLIENYPYPLIDRILVVDSPAELQLSRAIQRDQTSTAEIEAIMDTQASRKQRLELADDIIENRSDLASLKHQVTKLHDTYCKASLLD